MSRVFALSPSKYDITGATEYGEIVYLYNDINKPRMPYAFVDDFGQDVWRRMEQNSYDPDKDYLLIVGSHVILAQWVAAVISECEWCNALLFNSTDEIYVPRILGFKERMSDGQRSSRSLHV